ncbi:hypothetical protein [Microvirga thermotolerans]|uniref:Uncharacterized protein n=1 Tax=Microvirga thermotolerans TaxID=2651334 RepID=A0A5P9JRY3_9HYPH|nr:hypothetical protein [Microvirga thermotolerans]QFU15532.1 hypothetical protein GDR74_04505 [Microvirga thermotolerans]
MTAVADEGSIFENEEWLVTESGLEHKATGYFIERESLGAKRGDGLWAWPLHMAEKTWCAMTPFTEAFTCAVAFHRIESDIDLARSLSIARRDIARWPQPADAATAPLPTLQALQRPPRNPIYLERERIENSDNCEAFPPAANGRARLAEGLRPHATRTRARQPRFDLAQAPKRIRRTGTNLVRMIQAAWNIK